VRPENPEPARNARNGGNQPARAPEGQQSARRKGGGDPARPGDAGSGGQPRSRRKHRKARDHARGGEEQPARAARRRSSSVLTVQYRSMMKSELRTSARKPGCQTSYFREVSRGDFRQSTRTSQQQQSSKSRKKRRRRHRSEPAQNAVRQSDRPPERRRTTQGNVRMIARLPVRSPDSTETNRSTETTDSSSV